MKKLLFVLSACMALAGPVPAQPIRLIFDTDMGNDIDDAVALAMIHAFESREEAKLLAVTVTKDNRWAAPFIDAMNTFYGRPDIPIGTVRDGKTPEDADMIRIPATRMRPDGALVFPHRLMDGREAPEAVGLLRRTLSQEKDGAVTIVQVGFSTNLARLGVSGDVIDGKMTLVLESNGKFFWHHNIFCLTTPCPTSDAGTWTGYAPAKGEVQGRLRLKSASEVRHYVVVIGADGTIKLSRLGNTAKFENVGTWCDAVEQCDGQPNLIMVKCIAGYHSAPVCADTNFCSKTCVKDADPAPCVVTGCSGQVCADSNVMTTCEYRSEYACYKSASCERDAAGKCGWAKTATLDACLASGGACTYSDPHKKYVGTSSSQCMVIRFACTVGSTYFSDTCGCGCLTP